MDLLEYFSYKIIINMSELERTNKIKECNLKSTTETTEEVVKDISSICRDSYRLSSYNKDEMGNHEFVLKYKDNFLTCKLEKSKLSNYKLFNDSNLHDIIECKSINIKNMLYYGVNLFLEKSNEQVRYKMEILGSVKERHLNVSLNEELTLYFTKMTDNFLILNERLKNLESNKEYQREKVEMSFYEFFMS